MKNTDDSKDILNDKEKKTKVIAIDLDGVLADFTKGWQGHDVIGRPIVGAKGFLTKLKLDGWSIIIFTTRVKTLNVMEWLVANDMMFDKVNENIYPIETSGKVIADVYLDDRAVRFNGDYIDARFMINNFRVWYNKEAK